MAGRELIHPSRGDGRVPLPGQLLTSPPVDRVPFLPVEHKLAAQHAELQRVLAENQRLAAAHVALRQDLVAAQQEVPLLLQVISGLQSEKERELKALTEKYVKLEADLPATESLKSELQKHQTAAQKFVLNHQELTMQVQRLSESLLRAQAEAKQISALKNDMEAILQEVQRARTAFEIERKTNAELVEQRQVMEKNLMILAREVEKLRLELKIAEKKLRAGAHAASGVDIGYPPQRNLYDDRYSISQMGAKR